MRKVISTIGKLFLILSIIALSYYALVWSKPRLARGEITWLEDKLILLGILVAGLLSSAMIFIPKEGREEGKLTPEDLILSGMVMGLSVMAIGLFVSLMTYLVLAK
jgi:magnesium-transporting ATPase (P-type)